MKSPDVWKFCLVLFVNGKLVYQQVFNTYLDQPSYHLFPLLTYDSAL